ETEVGVWSAPDPPPPDRGPATPPMWGAGGGAGEEGGGGATPPRGSGGAAFGRDRANDRRGPAGGLRRIHARARRRTSASTDVQGILLSHGGVRRARFRSARLRLRTAGISLA